MLPGSERHCESVEEGSREDVSAGQTDRDRGYELEEDGVDGWDKEYGGSREDTFAKFYANHSQFGTQDGG